MCRLHRKQSVEKVLPASRSLHSSPSSQLAVQSTSSPAPSDTPVTTLAKAGSNQLSLETPQNKAGSHLRLGQRKKAYVNAYFRVCAVNTGQGRELGETRIHVAHDIRWVLHHLFIEYYLMLHRLNSSCP